MKKIKKYDHSKIEGKWQKKWDKTKIYEAKDDKDKPAFYGLIEFPYPSGVGLHVGHVRSNTAMDIICRKRRMQGYNVLYPIGWDAFGLPTENYAIKTGIHPEVVTKQNTDTFRRQLKSVGFSFDWSREIDTTNPNYYKWTQWIFLQFFKKGLAYKKKTFINWCLTCKIGLANEEVVAGKCERCGGDTEKRQKDQWMLAITKYAERLDKDLDDVDYLPRIKTQQRNWIGKSVGSEIDFSLIGEGNKENLGVVKIFTTRADTILGSTYIVLAPEHEILESLLEKSTNKEEVLKYIKESVNKKEEDRLNETKEKTGVRLEGVLAVNPANLEEISVWVADYVLGGYGTGAIMAVPDKDDRDREFAVKHNISIVETELVDSKEITEKLGGEFVVKYKLRDWVFSRQRYWGEPIPVIKCLNCEKDNPETGGYIPVPEEDLPVTLPKVDSYVPTDTGESPLANIEEWVNVKCPKCGFDARRETDTMPNWAGSSWYYLRYIDPHNSSKLASSESLEYWLGKKEDRNPKGVSWYNGGMEHTTLHLLYSRFWHKFLFDLGVVPTHEPYAKRTSHGMILAEGGEKMSKSKGNTVSPDKIVETYGADTLRIYEMFMGPFDQMVAWDTSSIIGPRRFLEKVWFLGQAILTSEINNTGDKDYASFEKILHKTIKKVGEDIEGMHFNTAISSMMILTKEMDRILIANGFIKKKDFELFLKIFAPFAPHITEEIWQSFGEEGSIHENSWPSYDESKTKDNFVVVVVQVNGKLRGDIKVRKNEEESTVKDLALKEIASKYIENKEVKRVIYVKDRLVNFVL